jgi:hypothetical protein
LKNMKSFDRKMEQLSIDFKKSICEDINIYAFVEGSPIDDKWGILVPTASAIRLSNNNYYIVEDVNHLTICKPDKRRDRYSVDAGAVTEDQVCALRLRTCTLMMLAQCFHPVL